ncbi:MAG: hypothetical protein P1U68_17510 [Verrucomicrobiales bacterium]|nr:hypothetical protein [Verrucomicrobiales bacterium]
MPCNLSGISGQYNLREKAWRARKERPAGGTSGPVPCEREGALLAKAGDAPVRNAGLQKLRRRQQLVFDEDCLRLALKIASPNTYG